MITPLEGRILSMGHTVTLKKLGHPLFSTDSNHDEWPAERITGVAWVVTCMDSDAMSALMSRDDRIERIDRAWQDHMAFGEWAAFNTWLNNQIAMAAASVNEATKRGGLPGKQES